MADTSKHAVAVRAFLGFSADADPHDRPPGLAVESVNVESHDPGVLRTRQGSRPIDFLPGPSPPEVYRSLTFYDHPDGPFLVGSGDRVWYVQSREGLLYQSSGDGPVLRWDGEQADWENAGVPAPTKPPLFGPSMGPDQLGFISGEWTAYTRLVDRYGNVGNPSPASRTVRVPDVSGVVEELSGDTPVRVTSHSHGLKPFGRTDISGLSLGPQIVIRWPTGVENHYYYEIIDDDHFDLYEAGPPFTGPIAPDPSRTAGGEWAQNSTGFHYLPQEGLLGGTVAMQFLRTKAGSAAAAYVDLEVEGSADLINPVGSTADDNGLGEPLVLVDPFTGDASYSLRFGLPPEDKPYLAPVGGRLVGAGDGAPGGTPPTYKRRRLVAWSEAGYPEGWYPLAAAFLPADSEGGPITGACSFDDAALIFCESRTFRFAFELDPATDGKVRPAIDRGVINNDCWVRTDEAVYALDRRGVYRTDGRAAESLSDAIQDLFAGHHPTLSLDWSRANEFHACFDPANDSVLFFVSLADEAPRHVLALRLKTGFWDLLEYPYALLSSTLARIDHRQRVVCGDEHGRLVMLDDGLADVLPGEGEEPDVEQGIAWRWRTGWYRWVPSPRETEQPRAIALTYRPTGVTSDLYLRLYRDQSDTPLAKQYSRRYFGITTERGSAELIVDPRKENGYVRYQMSGGMENTADGWRRVSVELAGTTSGDQHTIYQLDIEGAAP